MIVVSVSVLVQDVTAGPGPGGEVRSVMATAQQAEAVPIETSGADWSGELTIVAVKVNELAAQTVTAVEHQLKVLGHEAQGHGGIQG